MALEEILAAIWVAAAGDGLIAPSVTRRLIEEFPGRPEPAPPARALGAVTDRTREVLARVGRGLSNTELTAGQRVTMPMVETYVERLLAKLGARDRVYLVIMAYEAGLVAPPR
jgi:DNA-binding NarL/FixJ family response regulator